MRQSYQTILVGVDGSEQATLAFKKAVEVARRNQGKVIVVYIVDNSNASLMSYAAFNDSVLEHEKAAAKDILDELKSYADSVEFKNVETQIVFGSAKRLLGKDLPKEYGVNLIMVGQSGLNAAERFIVGSVASYVIRVAPCDVLIVANEGDDEEE